MKEELGHLTYTQPESSISTMSPPADPSISSMTTHVGLPFDLSPEPASKAFFILCETVPAFRSSLSQIEAYQSVVQSVRHETHLALISNTS